MRCLRTLIEPRASRPRSTATTPGLANNSRVGGGAQHLDRLADEARDLHLGEPDALADLGLGHLAPEAQVQDQPFALGQQAQELVDDGGILDMREGWVVAAAEHG